MESKKVSLTVLERMATLGILPKQGSYTDLLLVRELREQLTFSEEENNLLAFVPLPEGMVRWNKKAEVEIGKKEVSISVPMLAIIVKELKSLDERKKLDNDLLSIYTLFVLDRKE